MATIIPFPRPYETESAQPVESDPQDFNAPDLVGLMQDLRSDLAAIRAGFLIVQENLDSIISAEKDAQAH